MPRDGAITLTDLQAPFLRIVCEPCGRRGSYGVRWAADGGTGRRQAHRSPSCPCQLLKEGEFRREHL
jgi:hypothetical protein